MDCPYRPLECHPIHARTSGRRGRRSTGSRTAESSMSAAGAPPASDGAATSAEIASCIAVLSRLTPSALRDDPALAPLRELGVGHGVDTRGGRSYRQVVIDS